MDNASPTWGDVPQVRQGFPWPSLVLFVLLLGVIALLISDPIGRWAGASYKTATQDFIDKAFAPTTATVSKDTLKMTQLPKLSALPSSELVVAGGESERLGLYPRELAPRLEMEQIELPAPPWDEEAVLASERKRPILDVPDAEFPELDPEFKTLFGPQETTLFEPLRCTEMDRQSGLCGFADFDLLDKPQEDPRRSN